MVLDGLALTRGAFIRLEDYKLETAAQTFLGKGKFDDWPGRGHEIAEAFVHDRQKLVDYNLRDAELVLEILASQRLVELAISRSRLTGMQLDRVGASIASIDFLYLRELRRRGRVAPSVTEHPNAAVAAAPCSTRCLASSPTSSSSTSRACTRASFARSTSIP